MINRVIRICGFYNGQFINQDALITDTEDDVAMSLLKDNFSGAIFSTIKVVK